MRIDLNNLVASQVAAERSAKKSGKPETSPAGAGEDRTSFSHASVSLPGLVEGALKPSTARQERVATIREAVSNGQYKPDPHVTAAAMLKESGE